MDTPPIQTIDPLNYSVVQIHSLVDDIPIAKATGFFYAGIRDDKRCVGLVTNWHVLSGRHASKPEIVLNKDLAIPNRIRLEVRKGSTSEMTDRNLYFQEMYFDLYNPDGLALWHQHQQKNEIDVAFLNLNQSLEHLLVRGINELCSEYDMAIEIGNEVFVLGYPLGFSHFANTPIWKRASIASEPHPETHESRDRIMIDGTTRRGMSGAPVIMRYKTHYLTESGQIKAKSNASRFIGVYASRPAPSGEPTSDELESGLASHEIAYVFKSGCVLNAIQNGVLGPKYGELP